MADGGGKLRQAMEAATNVPVKRLEYKPPEYLVDHVHLVINIIDQTRVEISATLDMRSNPETEIEGEEAPLIKLDIGKYTGLIKSILIDGQNQIGGGKDGEEFAANSEALFLPGRKGQFQMQIKTAINPEKNDDCSGMYTAGDVILTQMESIGFRNFIPFPDRPDILPTWSTNVTAEKEKYPTLLATGNLVDTHDNPDGTHTKCFESDVKMPSYLYAAIAAKFGLNADTIQTPGRGKPVSLEIYAKEDKIARTKLAMDILKMAMEWDEKENGRVYPLDEFKMAAVDRFNFGAMENLGLNIFKAMSALGDPRFTTDEDMLTIALTVAHEFFHTWRGDMVTLKTWHEISLKEGFTVHTENRFGAELTGVGPNRIRTAKLMRAKQFAEDASATAHPILQNEYVGDPMKTMMYTATTYNKGGEVVGMLETMLGKDKFRAGTDKYFADFKGQAVSIEDLVASFEGANGVDLSQFRNWFKQVGTPVCKVRSSYDAEAKTFSLTVAQECPKEPKLPLHMPMTIGLVGPAGEVVPLELEGDDGSHDLSRGVLNVTKPEETFVFKNVPPGTIPSLFRNFSAPVKVEYDYSDKDLLNLMRNDEDGFNKYDAGQRIGKKEMASLVKKHQAGEVMAVNEDVLDAYGFLIQDLAVREPVLAADMLTLPSDSELLQEMDVYDFEAVKSARETLRLAIATKFRTDLRGLYHRYQALAAEAESKADAPTLNVEAIRMRKIKNVCLGYLGKLAGEEEIALLKNQMAGATNMSDELQAVALLADIPQERDAVLSSFGQKWKSEEMVGYKFLRVQGLMDDEKIVEKARTLVESEGFDIEKQDNITNLIIFGLMKNFAYFHDKSGEGYRLAGDLALRIKNGIISARVVKDAFSDYPKVDGERRALMKVQLERVIAGSSDDGTKTMAKKILGV